MTAPVIAATYARVSTRMQGQFGFSLGNQDQTLEDFVAANGWTNPPHLRFKDGEDENASGADWDLPDLTRMLEAARRGEFRVLAVPDFDRFARSLTKGLVLEEQLKKYGVRVVFQRVPVEDTPEGHLLKTQLYAFAEYDRQRIVLRTTMGRRAKAGVGKVVGTGTPAYGYRYLRELLPTGKERVCSLEPDPVTGPIARGALLALRRRSCWDVAGDLNDRGVPPPRGTAWLGTTLRRMAMNPVYAGTWRYGSTTVAVAPLLSDDEAAQIRAALAVRRTTRRGRRPLADDPFLLRGRLTCGHCHGPLQANVNQRWRYYTCGCAYPSSAREMGRPPCDLPSVHAADVEAELWRVLDATLLNREYLAAGLDAARAQHDQADRLRTERLETVDGEIAKYRKRLDRLADDLTDAGDGEFRASIRRRAQEIEGLIGRLREERDALAATAGVGLSAEEADAIEAFAAEMRAGMAAATPADRRELYARIQVRGAVRLAAAGDKAVRLGRLHRYRIDWTAAFPLLDSDASFL